MFISFLKFLMRWTQRIILTAGLIALGVWLFYIGREHRIFLDNRAFENHQSLAQVNVSINGGEVVELMSRERGILKVVGAEFELKAEIFDIDGKIINTIEKIIKPAFSRDIMINLPTLAAGAENYILPAPK